jgi:hypothetical protein
MPEDPSVCCWPTRSTRGRAVQQRHGSVDRHSYGLERICVPVEGVGGCRITRGAVLAMRPASASSKIHASDETVMRAVDVRDGLIGDLVGRADRWERSGLGALRW